MFLVNKPKLIMYDFSDYGGSGAIGTPSGSNSLYSAQDLPPLADRYPGPGDTAWDLMGTTMRATRDAFAKALSEYILITNAFYVDLISINDSVIKPGDRYLVGISENNLEILFDVMNDIWDKFLESCKWEYVYWNFFRVDKYSGEQTFTHEVYTYDIEKFAMSYTTYEPYVTTVFAPININFDNYPTLTSEIYENYINSFKEYIFAIKKYIVLATGSTFEDIEEPLDLTQTFVPPHTQMNYE